MTFAGIGIAIYPDGAQCRTRPYIFTLTEYWTFCQPALALSALGVSPQRAPPDPLPARETANVQGSFAQF